MLHSARNDKLTNHLSQRLLFSLSQCVIWQYVSIDEAFDFCRLKPEINGLRLLTSQHFTLSQACRKISASQCINSLQIDEKICQIFIARERNKTDKPTGSLFLDCRLHLADWTLLFWLRVGIVEPLCYRASVQPLQFFIFFSTVDAVSWSASISAQCLPWLVVSVAITAWYVLLSRILSAGVSRRNVRSVPYVASDRCGASFVLHQAWRSFVGIPWHVHDVDVRDSGDVTTRHQPRTPQKDIFT